MQHPPDPPAPYEPDAASIGPGGTFALAHSGVQDEWWRALCRVRERQKTIGWVPEDKEWEIVGYLFILSARCYNTDFDVADIWKSMNEVKELFNFGDEVISPLAWKFAEQVLLIHWHHLLEVSQPRATFIPNNNTTQSSPPSPGNDSSDEQSQPCHYTVQIRQGKVCVITLNGLPFPVASLHIRVFNEGGELNGEEVTGDMSFDDPSQPVLQQGKYSWRLVPRHATSKLFAHLNPLTSRLDRKAVHRIFFSVTDQQGRRFHWEWKKRLLVVGRTGHNNDAVRTVYIDPSELKVVAELPSPKLRGAGEKDDDADYPPPDDDLALTIQVIDVNTHEPFNAKKQQGRKGDEFIEIGIICFNESADVALDVKCHSVTDAKGNELKELNAKRRIRLAPRSQERIATYSVKSSDGMLLLADFFVMICDHQKTLYRVHYLWDSDEGEKIQEAEQVETVASATPVSPTTAWEIDYKDFSRGKRIGSGAFGTVYLGTYKRAEVAIKELTDPNLSLKYIEKEIKSLYVMRHPNVVTMYGVCICDEGIFIITEYVSGGDLRKFLDRYELNTRLKLRILLDVSVAMEFMHSKRYIHRDLKTPNLLVTKDHRIKLTDFGLARQIAADSSVTFSMGTMEWMAPEILLQEPYNLEADVFSFGVVMMEVITGDKPARRNPLHYYAITPPAEPEGTPAGLWSLVNDCLNTEPAKRPSFRELTDSLKKMLSEWEEKEKEELASPKPRGHQKKVNAGQGQGN